MIAICPNQYRDIDLEFTKKIKAYLEELGYSTRICQVFGEDRTDLFPEACYMPLEELNNDCELAIVLGGDGTVLETQRRLSNFSIPLLGINLGSKGFLTSLEPDEFERIEEILKGKRVLSTRMLLEVQVKRGGEVVYQGDALNDVVIHGYVDCIKLNVFCNGTQMTSFSGDGLILSTPTGSTGYSMSAGGPIVEPDAENIIVSHICAHSISACSFVLSKDRTVEIYPEKIHDRKAYLSVDGHIELKLRSEDVLTVKESTRKAIFASTGDKSFFASVLTKLS